MYKKEMRLNLGLSQEEFADKIGVCSQCVSNWETGLTKPSIASMKKIINYCKENNIKYLEET